MFSARQVYTVASLGAASSTVRLLLTSLSPAMGSVLILNLLPLVSELDSPCPPGYGGSGEASGLAGEDSILWEDHSEVARRLQGQNLWSN